MASDIRIDQAGLAVGTPGESRTDGLDTGAQVTLTNVAGGATLFRLLWVPVGDTTAVSTLAPTTPGGPVWTFLPTAARYGTYLIELIRNQGQTNESSERRLLRIRTPNHGFCIPALNELGDPEGSLLNNGPEVVDISDDNATDYPDPNLNPLNYSGWWRTLHEWILGLDTLVSGGEPNTGANVGGGAGVFRDKTGITLNFRSLVGTGGITITQLADTIEVDGGGITAIEGVSGTGPVTGYWIPIYHGTPLGVEESPPDDRPEVRQLFVPGFNWWLKFYFTGVSGDPVNGIGSGSIGIARAGREGGRIGLDGTIPGAAGGWDNYSGIPVGSSNLISPMVLEVIPNPSAPTQARVVLACGRQVSSVQKVWYSDDGGLNWTAANVARTDSAGFFSMVWSGQLLVGGYSTSPHGIETSSDGVTWTTRAVPDAQARRILASNGTGTVVAMSYSTYMYSLDHGVTWTASTLPSWGLANLGGMVFWDGKFVVLGYDPGSPGQLNSWTSTDGINWTKNVCTFSSPAFEATQPHPLLAYHRGFVVSGEVLCAMMWQSSDPTQYTEGLFYSFDGIVWHDSFTYSQWITSLPAERLRTGLVSSTPKSPAHLASLLHQLYISPSIGAISNPIKADGYLSNGESSSKAAGVFPPLTTDDVLNVSLVPGGTASDALDYLLSLVGGGASSGVIWDPDVVVDTAFRKSTLQACVASLSDGVGTIYMVEGAVAAFNVAAGGAVDFDSRISLANSTEPNTVTFTDSTSFIRNPRGIVSSVAPLLFARSNAADTRGMIDLDRASQAVRFERVVFATTSTGEAPTLRLLGSGVTAELVLENCQFITDKVIEGGLVDPVIRFAGNETQFTAADLFDGFSTSTLDLWMDGEFDWDTTIVGVSFLGTETFHKVAPLFPPGVPLLQGLLNNGTTTINVVDHDAGGNVFRFRGVPLTALGAGTLFLADDGVYKAVSAGEVNTGANVGGGNGVFRDKTGVTLNFRTLVAGTNVSMVQAADTITISASAGSVSPLSRVLYVDAAAAGGGTGSISAPFNTIQAALNVTGTAAPANWVLLIVPGTYNEALTFPNGRKLSLINIALHDETEPFDSFPEVSIIAPAGTHTVNVTSAPSTIVLRGLDISDIVVTGTANTCFIRGFYTDFDLITGTASTLVEAIWGSIGGFSGLQSFEGANLWVGMATQTNSAASHEYRFCELNFANGFGMSCSGTLVRAQVCRISTTVGVPSTPFVTFTGAAGVVEVDPSTRTALNASFISTVTNGVFHTKTLYRYVYNATDFEIPNSSNWAINAAALVAADSVNAALTVARFSDTTEQGVGFTLHIPLGCSRMYVYATHRAQTSPGGAVQAQPTLRARSIPDNGAITAWSAEFDLTPVALPAGGTNWQQDGQGLLFSSLGLVAGRTTQFELTRQGADGDDTLSGDWVLAQFIVEFT
jgi:hypothetical protein